MPDEIGKLVRDVKDAESAFSDAVASQQDHATGPQSINVALNHLRASVDQLSLSDLIHARQNSAEGRLWTAHTKLRDVYKKRLKTLRIASPARPVETRKLIKAYLEFLKDGQRWYRTFISRLNHRYGLIPELKQIAGHVPAATAATNIDEAAACLASCYQSLICLGDLSRWRTAEQLDRDTTWGPAIGYYDLAIALRPTSGFAFNQRSLIAHAERDFLRMTYYVYRSIVVAEPFERSMENLAVHINSMRKKWANELSPAVKQPGPEAASKTLTAWFLRLHCLCFVGETTANHDEMEREVLNRIESLIMSAQSSKLLMKMVLINMAAEHTALLRMQNADTGEMDTLMRSFGLYQQLNFKTMRLLVDTWIKVVGAVTPSAEVASLGRLRAPKAQISHITNVVLPLLRMYSVWLCGHYKITLLEQDSNSEAAAFWTQFALLISATFAAYPPQSLPSVPYLLDEDVDVAGFKPLDHPGVVEVWQYEHGHRKPKPSEQRVHRSPAQVEASARIRDIQKLGLFLATQEDKPLDFDGERFTFTGLSIPVPPLPADAARSTSGGAPGMARAAVTPPPPSATNDPDTLHRQGFVTTTTLPLQSPVRFRQALSVSPQIDDQEELARSMVDELVGPDESPYPMQRSASQLDVTSLAEPTLTDFSPTQLSLPSAPRQRNTGIFSAGELMASPLLFGHNSVWSSGRSMSKQTPPNGQGGL